MWPGCPQYRHALSRKRRSRSVGVSRALPSCIGSSGVGTGETREHPDRSGTPRRTPPLDPLLPLTLPETVVQGDAEIYIFYL